MRITFYRHYIKNWIYTIAQVVLFLSMLILVYLIASKHNKVFDITPLQKYSLSEQTVKILKNLSKNINIKVFYQKDKRSEADHLLKRFVSVSSNISYSLNNLDKNPGAAKKYNINSYGESVIECGDKITKAIYTTEESIINAILKATKQEVKPIYFVTGHGEKNPFDSDKKKGYSLLLKAMELENYTVKQLSLSRNKGVPEDASILMICGPEKDFLKEELAGLSTFFNQGGKLIVMIDPYTVPALSSFLKKYGLITGNDIIVDKTSRLFGNDYFTPIAPFYYKNHPITKTFNIETVFPFARSVQIGKTTIQNVSCIPLVKTSPDSWAESNINSVERNEAIFNKNSDKKGPVTVAAMAIALKENDYKNIAYTQYNKIKSAICLFGDSDFVSNRYLNILGNKDLILNVAAWLSQQEDLISLRPKTPQNLSSTLTVKQGKVIFWILVIVEPVLVLLAALLIYLRRVRKG